MQMIKYLNNRGELENLLLIGVQNVVMTMVVVKMAATISRSLWKEGSRVEVHSQEV